MQLVVGNGLGASGSLGDGGPLLCRTSSRSCGTVQTPSLRCHRPLVRGWPAPPGSLPGSL